MRKIIAITALLVCGALAAADLNTFIHGGSMDRPLAGTTSSAEGMFNVNEETGLALDAVSRLSDGGVLETVFDSWCRYRAEAFLNGTFNSTKFGSRIILR
jgi:hypothetical protein